ATGWTGTCTTLTVGSSNGWNTNFDNLVLGSAAAATITATPTATATPGSTSRTLTFDDLSNPNRPLNGQYPSAVVDWGSDVWYLSGPYGAFTSNSVSFNGLGPTSATLRFVSPARLVQVEVYNGGTSRSTVSLACSGQPTLNVNVSAGTRLVITTGWAGVCST